MAAGRPPRTGELGWLPTLVGALILGALGGLAYLALDLAGGRLGPRLFALALGQGLLLRGLVRATGARGRLALLAVVVVWLAVAPVAIGRWAPGASQEVEPAHLIGQAAVLLIGAAAGAWWRRPASLRRARAATTPLVAPGEAMADWERDDAVRVAANEGRWDRVLELLAAGADPHAYCDAHGMSVLAYAARARRADVVKEILAKGVRPTSGFDRDGTSPVYQAIAAQDAEIVALLLRGGLSFYGLRDGRGRSPLAAALESGSSRDLVETVLAVVPFGRHSPEEQQALLELVQRHADPGLVELLQQPVPFGAPTAAHQAHERGIGDIELGRSEREGVSYLPLSIPECIDFHPIDGRGRSELASSRPPWWLEERDREELRRLGGQWFEPFLERLAQGRDFTLEDLEEAHRAAKGGPLQVNTLQY